MGIVDLIKNIHTYPLIDLVTLDTVGTAILAYVVAKYTNASNIQDYILIFVLFFLLNLFFHLLINVRTNLSSYLGID